MMRSSHSLQLLLQPEAGGVLFESSVWVILPSWVKIYKHFRIFCVTGVLSRGFAA